VDPSLVPYFVSGGGFAGLVVVCFVMGWIHPSRTCEDKDRQIRDKQEEIKEYKKALELERARSDAGVLAASVAKDVMESLRKEA
jgi:hypothetical protein